MTRTILAFSLALALVAGVTAAQEQTPEPEPPRAAEVEVTVGVETSYPLDPSHPLIFYLDRQIVSNAGVWVGPMVFLRTEDGFVALTECDDIIVPCVPLRPVRATGPLEDVPQGTSFGIVRIAE